MENEKIRGEGDEDKRRRVREVLKGKWRCKGKRKGEAG